MKLMKKRILSLLLALAMVVSLMPGLSLTVEAAEVKGDLSDSGIILSYEESAKSEEEWIATDTSIVGNLKGVKSGSWYQADKTILTITNGKVADAKLSFNYKVSTSYGSVKLDGSSLSGTGSKEIEIVAGDSVEIALNVEKTKKESSATIEISNISLLADVEATTVFAIAENGTYEVNGVEIKTEKECKQSSAIAYELSATASAGYEFFGWYSVGEEKYVSYDSETQYVTDVDRTIVPKFVPLSTPIFQVGTRKYVDLKDATDYAKANKIEKVVLVSDGEISGDYTIPVGVTLLIPFDENNTCYKEEPETIGKHPTDDTENPYAPNPWEKPFPYRTLTMLNGATINVEGELSVSAKHSSGAQYTAGSPSGSCGFINMAEGSNIYVEDGAALYAWGYIVGDGVVTAQSGGVVYENMQIADFRGGNATLQIGGSFGKTFPYFPFSQYYIQNIESKLVLEHGAEERIVTSIFLKGNIYTAPVTFIGGEDAMFVIEEGAVISKEYNGKKDRLEVNIDGDAVINSMAVGLAGVTMDSADYILPINSNIDININSGTTVTNQNLVLLPGSRITVAKDATVNTWDKLTIFDYDDYSKGYPGIFEEVEKDVFELRITGEEVTGKFVHPSCDFVPVKYAYDSSYTRTEEDITDVVVDVNGTIIADEAVYSTLGGAEVISSEGTGRISLALGAFEDELDKYTFQYIMSGNVAQLICVPVTSVLLNNGDGTYTETLGADYDALFCWSKISDKWIEFMDADGDEGEYDLEVIYNSNGAVYNVESDLAGQDASDECIWITKEDVLAGVPHVFDTADDFDWIKEGYEFLGWSTDKNATEAEYKAGDEIVILEEATFYAVWKAPKYTLTFDLNGGTTGEGFEATKEYEVGAELQFPANPTKTGAEFAGWLGNDGKTYEAGAKMPANALTLTAQWKDTEYTLTFIDGDSTNAAGKTYGAPITVPSALGKEGHSFDGWKDADGNIVNAEEIPATMPAKNLTYTAVYSVNSYEYTYKVEGSADIVETQKYGEAVKVPADPSKEGHSFCGWVDTDTDKVVTLAGATIGAKDKTFEASFTPNSYNVTFDLKGGTKAETVKLPESFKFGEPVVLPTDADDFTKVGYTFDGWKLADDKDVPATMPAENLTFEAQWKVNKYTITFANTGDSGIAPITGDYNSAVTAPADPTKKGYTFAGWDNEIPATMPAEDMTITANWSVNNYTITFNTDGGKAVEPMTVAYGADVNVTVISEKDGHSFIGWKLADKDGNVIGDGKVPATMPAEDIYLKAEWGVEIFTITFDTAGGSPVEDITGEYGSPVTVPKAPTREGYNFLGWDKQIPTTMPAENVTITAKWQIKTGIAITFDTAGGSAIEPIKGTYGDAVTAPANPTKTGYTFAGWDKEIPKTIPAEDVTITAKWTINQYTITFNTDGGSKVDSIKQNYASPVTVPADPTKVGYDFAGWDKQIPTTMPAEDMTITAKWNPKNYDIVFDSVGGSDVDTINAAYGSTVEAPKAPTKADYTFVCWLDKDGNEVTFPVTMPLDGMKLTAKWKYTYTGWKTEDGKTTYLKDGEKAYKDTVADIEEDTYYFDKEGYIVTGLVKVADSEVENGFIYYYFDAENGGKAVKEESRYLKNLNKVLPEWEYTFDENGVILHEEDTAKSGIQKDDAGTLCYYINGIKVYMGLVRVGEDYYYVRSSGALVVDRTYWISRVDGLDFKDNNGEAIELAGKSFEEKAYTFNTEGKLVFEEEVIKDGIVKEEGSLYYYENGVRTYKGLMLLDGNYYYVRTSGELAHSRNYWITKHNGLLPEGSYKFDEEGKIVIKDGIVEEDGSLYYYENGVRTYKGLMLLDGNYYYVRTSGELAHSRDYWITKHNDLLPEALYTFDEEGKMVRPDESKDGIVEEDGTLYYYEKGVRTYKGLFEKDGHLYYAKTSGEVVNNRDYWITKTNGLLPEKSYTFNELGQIVLD